MSSSNNNIEQKKVDMPCHIAIIMDGNGRWAKKRNLPRVMGHREGAKNIRKIVYKAQKMGIRYLTVYAFSTENWTRPKVEVDALMELFQEYLKKEKKDMNDNNVRLTFSGSKDGLSKNVMEVMEQTESFLAKNTGITFNIAFNYGGRKEILEAVNKIVNQRVELASKGEAVLPVSEKDIVQNLYHPEIPDPELVIRTSGEFRTSNFLLWEAAYAEYYITEKYWPEFSEEELEKAVNVYQKRERRFGGV